MPAATLQRLSDLLRLRRWVLARLAGESAEEGRAPPTDPAIWRTFLDHERCATALGACLDDGARAAIGPAAAAVLAEFRRLEARRILAVRGQLAELAEVARETGARIVVLKGALCIAEGAGLDLEDIDLLAPEDAAPTVGRALDDLGYRPLGYSTGRHLRTRAAEGKLPIEVHLTTDIEGEPLPDEVWRALEPVAGWPDLRRLAPAEHLWHVLSHIVVDHPERRGRLRDLLLVRSALDGCSATELAEVRRRMEADPLAAPLRALLEMARSLEAGNVPGDAFEEVALANYLLRPYTALSSLPGTLGALAWRWSFALAAGPVERGMIWRETVRRSVDRSKFGFISRVERAAPRIGALWRYGLRLVRLPFALALSGFIAGLVKYTIFRFRESESRGGHTPQAGEGPMVKAAASSRVTSGT